MDIFCPKLARFGATLIAPWFLKETYKLDPLWIRFFVLYKIDEWAQIDLGTPSTPKLVFFGPRLRWKMDQKVKTFKPQKMKTVLSTFVGSFAMECHWTWIGWLLTGLRHSQGLAQHTFGPHRCPRASPNGHKRQNSRAKKSAKNPKKIWKFFFYFFGFQWLKQWKISSYLHKSA